MGEIEQNLAKQAVRFGNPLPDRIANAPRLQLGLEIFIQAFYELDSERSHGLGPTPIPPHLIKEYAATYDFDEEMTDDLLFFVRGIDKEHLKEIKRKQDGNS